MKKNLRKLLVLVLVFAMVLSVSAIAASATSFTDTSSTKYGEAIGVLSGIGVINGTTSTTFNPTDALTREQAAKIITYMLLGPTNAAMISTASTQKFSDVAPDRWSAGYIEYCANAGIIGGTGNGTFNPTGVLTTAAFTKMLLCAVGYNASAEGLVGDSWVNNTASLALSAGIYDSGIAITGSVTCTREQGAQLALKALQATLVQYTGGSTITIGDSTITTGATRSYVTNGNSAAVPPVHGASDGNISSDYLMQFAEKYFPNLDKSTGIQGGRNGYTWLNGTTPVSDFVSSDVVLSTSASGTSFAWLTDPTNAFFNGQTADNTVTYYYNDTAVSANWPVNAAGVAANTATVQGYAATTGVVVRFIDTDNNGKYDVVSVVQQQVAQLASAPITTTSGSVTYVNVGPLANIQSTNITYPAGLQKNDVILYYQSGIHYYVTKATPVSGAITSYGFPFVTVNGTNYFVGTLSGEPGAYNTFGEVSALLGAPGFTFYVDAYNNIIYTTGASGATLTNTYLVTATQPVSNFGTTYQAKVVAPDGTSSVITVENTASYGGTLTPVTTTTAGNTTSGNLGAGIFYTYSKLSDGDYNLTVAQNQSANVTTMAGGTVAANDTSYTVTNSQANFLTKVTATGASWTSPAPTTAVQTVLATSSTVFLYWNPVTLTYSVFTGIANAPSYSAGGTIYVLNDSTNTYATVVVCTGATSTVLSAVDQVFVTGYATTTLDSTGTPLYTYSAVINGVAGKSITSYAAMNRGSVYYINDYTNGIANTVMTSYSLATPVAGLTTVSYAGGTFTANGSSFILNSNVAVFMYDQSANTVTQITPDAAAAYTTAPGYAAGTDSLTVVKTSSTDATISYVYISVA